MPIKLPSDLPAYDVLTREGVMVLDEKWRRVRTSGLCALPC